MAFKKHSGGDSRGAAWALACGVFGDCFEQGMIAGVGMGQRKGERKRACEVEEIFGCCFQVS